MRVLAACFIVLGLAYPAVAVAEVRQFEPSMGMNAFQWGPRTDGEMVVWSERATNDVMDMDSDIYGAHLNNGVVFPIATGSAIQSEPDVDAGIVVWKNEPGDDNCFGCDRSVYGKVLATGEQFVIAEREELEDHRPAISGDWVVWEAFGNSGSSIWARNIGGIRHGQPLGDPLLVYEGGVGRNLAFDNERLVWTQESQDGWTLFTMKIGDAAPVVLAEGGSVSGLSFGYDVARDVVVYMDSANNVAAIDLRTSETITTSTSTGYDQGPTTDGRYVFWLHITRPGADRLVFDLWGFDLLTRAFFPVSIGTEWVGSTDTAGGVVVWSRRLSDDISRVYAAQISDVLPSARQSAPDETGPNLMYFPETGHTLIYGFKGYWERNGGLPVFGFPMTQEFQVQQADGWTYANAQYFERQRFEWHPEHEGTPYEVLLGRLGAEDVVRRELLGDPAFQPIAGADAGCTYFEATGHQICGAFQVYWREHGLELGDGGVSQRESLALFGYPLSEPFIDPTTGLETQYFERAVFELHPENPEPYKVLLRRLGAEELARWDW